MVSFVIILMTAGLTGPDIAQMYRVSSKSGGRYFDADELSAYQLKIYVCSQRCGSMRYSNANTCSTWERGAMNVQRGGCNIQMMINGSTRVNAGRRNWCSSKNYDQAALLPEVASLAISTTRSIELYVS